MAKEKKVVFEDVDTLQSIEELTKETEEQETDVTFPTEEEIDKFFTEEAVFVEEMVYKPSVIDVIPLRDFRTNYGGVQYFFTKGKRQSVPVEVRDFLLRNKQNPRIKDIY